MKHYLISLPLGPDAYVHTYLMTEDKRDIEPATSKMLDETEKMIGQPVPLPMVMLTGPLNKKDVAVVHKVVNREPEVAAVLAEATKYHLSIWLMRKEDPLYASLLELH